MSSKVTMRADIVSRAGFAPDGRNLKISRLDSGFFRRVRTMAEQLFLAAFFVLAASTAFAQTCATFQPLQNANMIGSTNNVPPWVIASPSTDGSTGGLRAGGAGGFFINDDMGGITAPVLPTPADTMSQTVAGGMTGGTTLNFTARWNNANDGFLDGNQVRIQIIYANTVYATLTTSNVVNTNPPSPGPNGGAGFSPSGGAALTLTGGNWTGNGVVRTASFRLVLPAGIPAGGVFQFAVQRMENHPLSPGTDDIGVSGISLASPSVCLVKANQRPNGSQNFNFSLSNVDADLGAAGTQTSATITTTSTTSVPYDAWSGSAAAAGVTPMTVINPAQPIVITESPANGFAASAISCTGLIGGAPTVDLAQNRITIPANAVVAAPTTGLGAICTFTNTRPRVRLQKALPNGRAVAADQFALSIAGPSGAAAASATATTTGGGATATGVADFANADVGGSYTLSETMAAGSTSAQASYASQIACTNANAGSATVLPTGAGTSFTIGNVAAADDIVCTISNTPRTATLQLAKAWAAGSTAGNQVTVGATTGGTNNTAGFTATAPNAADSGAPVIVTAGNVVTLPAEGGANVGNYTTTLACTGGHTLSGTNGQQANTLTFTGANAAVCTYTNTPRTATLQLAKAWAAGSTAGNQVTVGATTGGTDNTAGFTATAPNAADSGAPVIVTAGNVVTLPAEGGANVGNYTTTLACTGGHTLSGTNGQQANTLTFTGANAAVCTYTNTPRTATLQLAKAWAAGSTAGNQVTVGATTGGTNNTAGFTATAPNAADSGAPVIVTAGNVVTLPAEGGANVGNYTTTLACTGGHTLSGTNGQQANTLTFTGANAAVCTYTNTMVDARLTIVKSSSTTTLVLGQPVNYQFVVTNAGNVTLTAVGVTDNRVDGGTVTCPATTLAPDAQTTCTGARTVTQADVDAGSVTNTATATGTPPGGGTVTSPPGTTTVPATQAPSLTIRKTAGTPVDVNADGLTDADDTIAYTFRVTNTGNVTLKPVVVNDAKVSANGTISCTPASLAPGAFVDCGPVTYTITAADQAAGTVDNLATATGTPPTGPTVTSPPSTTSTPVTAPRPALTIVKSSSTTTLVLGQPVNYQFVVTNAGNVTLTAVGVTDNRVDGGTVTCPATTLAPDAQTTCTGARTVTQADVDAGSVTNTATATGTPPGGGTVTSPPGTTTVPATQAPSLTIRKTAGTPVDVNADGLTDADDTIAYTFRVTNTGNVTLKPVVVNDAKVSANGTISCTPASLAPGAFVDCGPVTYTITAADQAAGTVDNLATATGTPPTGPTVTSPPSTTSTPVTAPAAQIGISKQAGSTTANADGTFDVPYTLLVQNTGNVLLANVSVVDDLVTQFAGGFDSIVAPPAVAGVTIRPGSTLPLANAGYTGGAGSALASDGTLIPGDRFSVTVTVRIKPYAVSPIPATFNNTATASGTPPGTTTPVQDDSNNGSDPTVGPGGRGVPTSVPPPTAQPRLNLLKAVSSVADVNGNGVNDAGDVVNWALRVENAGNVPLRNVTINDQLQGVTVSGGQIALLAPGAVDATTFTASYTIKATDVPGDVVNTATASGSPPASAGDPTPDPVVSEPSSTTTPTKATETKLDIKKTAGVRLARRGDTVSYAILVTNNGAANAGPLNVVDQLPAGFLYLSGSGKVDGQALEPLVSGRTLTFGNVEIAAGHTTVVTLQVRISSSVDPGDHANTAVALDRLTGAALSPQAKATVRVEIEHVFDCGEIIGKVFDDRNRNGYQDEDVGEPGLPGVRLATVRGRLITTDKYGRFNVPCADIPDARIGSNFILKLDTRTLPSGYRLTTENPRVVRLTRGKLTKLNFGAAIDRVVRIDLNNTAFENSSSEPGETLRRGLGDLISALDREHAVVRLTYYATANEERFAQERLRRVSALLRQAWKKAGGSYELGIETEIVRR